MINMGPNSTLIRVTEILRVSNIPETAKAYEKVTIEVDNDYHSSKQKYELNSLKLRGNDRIERYKPGDLKEINYESTSAQLIKLITSLGFKDYKICEIEGIYKNGKELVIGKAGFVGLSFILTYKPELWHDNYDSIIKLLSKPITDNNFENINNTIESIIMINILEQGLPAITKQVLFSKQIDQMLLEKSKYRLYYNELYQIQQSIIEIFI